MDLEALLDALSTSLAALVRISSAAGVPEPGDGAADAAPARKFTDQERADFTAQLATFRQSGYRLRALLTTYKLDSLKAHPEISLKQEIEELEKSIERKHALLVKHLAKAREWELMVSAAEKIQLRAMDRSFRTPRDPPGQAGDHPAEKPGVPSSSAAPKASGGGVDGDDSDIDGDVDDLMDF
ncbi:hypothetical protein DFJ74DRAFT_648676 [Hyaloraphidium curvatum]|nr:hypothetical protein DFJ74DRAFT_648676 [Hyaloraphidium curvatum]